MNFFEDPTEEDHDQVPITEEDVKEILKVCAILILMTVAAIILSILALNYM